MLLLSVYSTPQKVRNWYGACETASWFLDGEQKRLTYPRDTKILVVVYSTSLPHEDADPMRVRSPRNTKASDTGPP